MFKNDSIDVNIPLEACNFRNPEPELYVII